MTIAVVITGLEWITFYTVALLYDKQNRKKGFTMINRLNLLVDKKNEVFVFYTRMTRDQFKFIFLLQRMLFIARKLVLPAFKSVLMHDI